MGMDGVMQQLLQQMRELEASDLHLKALSPPGFRVDGELRPGENMPRLAPEQVKELAYSIMTPRQRKAFEEDKDLDFSYSLKDGARFRINVLSQRGTMGMVVRYIPDVIPSMHQLGMPEVCRRMADRPRGIVLVTGPTGSGKSTTLASMIDYINTNREGHVITMEDPLEFIHRDKRCYITQRQIGQDSPTFSQALRRALRQDPDVILIGELRDLETIQMAMTAAETGHLVLATLHTVGAIQTIDRIIDVFSSEAQPQVRLVLSATLVGVISQVLLPCRSGGRVAAREILVATDGVRSLIREGKTSQMLSLQQTGKSVGMLTLEQALAELVIDEKIDMEAAREKANRPDEIDKILQHRGYRAPKRVIDEMEELRQGARKPA